MLKKFISSSVQLFSKPALVGIKPQSNQTWKHALTACVLFFMTPPQRSIHFINLFCDHFYILIISATLLLFLATCLKAVFGNSWEKHLDMDTYCGKSEARTFKLFYPHWGS